MWNQDFGVKYYLPFALPERVVVEETFLTRDLVFAMNRTPRYWVLVFSEQPTRLFEGTRDTLVEVQEGGFPMTHEGPGGATSLPGGFGVNVSATRDERHRQFFRAVDEALKPFQADDPLPLAVVGVDRFQAFFAELTAHEDSILATLNGSHDKTSPSDLAKLVWPLVEAGLAANANRSCQNWIGLSVSRKSLPLSARYGGWRTKGADGSCWLKKTSTSRQLDETGIHLSPADGPTAPGVIDDAVDDIIETVLSKQGRVVFTADGQLSTHQQIALILRY